MGDVVVQLLIGKANRKAQRLTNNVARFLVAGLPRKMLDSISSITQRLNKDYIRRIKLYSSDSLKAVYCLINSHRSRVEPRILVDVLPNQGRMNLTKALFKQKLYTVSHTKNGLLQS